MCAEMVASLSIMSVICILDSLRTIISKESFNIQQKADMRISKKVVYCKKCGISQKINNFIVFYNVLFF